MIETWNDFFKKESEEEYAKRLSALLDYEYSTQVIYPPRHEMFNAFKLTPLKDVKVVIIGQDPYHEEGQAMGLSFSVPEGVTLPPSLINIYKEMSDDLGIKFKKNGDLTYLAKQGVLLLNAILSVRKGVPLSHKDFGYETFLHHVLSLLNEMEQPIVFILWGSFARSLKKFLNNPRHLILEGTHPSPLSANRGGFFKGKYFSKTNEFLIQNNVTPIDWKN